MLSHSQIHYIIKHANNALRVGPFSIGNPFTRTPEKSDQEIMKEKYEKHRAQQGPAQQPKKDVDTFQGVPDKDIPVVETESTLPQGK